MKVAFVLLTVLFLAVTSLADNHPHSAHHVVKHTTQEGGHDLKKAKHATHAHVKKAGKKAHHDEEHAKKGGHEVVKHKIDDSEGGGKKSSAHHQDSHQSHKKAAGHSDLGAKFSAGKGHKKYNVKKGFRELYHKDEHKKNDAFYSNGHKSGEFKRFGSKNHKYHSQHLDKDSHGKYITKKHSDKYGKDGKKGDGHKYASHKGYQHENGDNKHYEKHSKWGKKNNKHHGNHHEAAYLPQK